MGAQAGDPAARTCKAALRSRLLAERRNRPPDAGAAQQRCAALLAVPEIAAADMVAAYAALSGEPDLNPLLAQLRAGGVRVLLPRVRDDLDLDFYAGETPVALDEADVVLVPALAADRAGHRLGRGGGSYDRALLRVRADALVLAVVHAEELLREIPVEAHDLRVGAVLAGSVVIRVDRRGRLQ